MPTDIELEVIIPHLSTTTCYSTKSKNSKRHVNDVMGKMSKGLLEKVYDDLSLPKPDAENLDITIYSSIDGDQTLSSIPPGTKTIAIVKPKEGDQDLVRKTMVDWKDRASKLDIFIEEQKQRDAKRDEEQRQRDKKRDEEQKQRDAKRDEEQRQRDKKRDEEQRQRDKKRDEEVAALKDKVATLKDKVATLKDKVVTLEEQRADDHQLILQNTADLEALKLRGLLDACRRKVLDSVGIRSWDALAWGYTSAQVYDYVKANATTNIALSDDHLWRLCLQDEAVREEGSWA